MWTGDGRRPFVCGKRADCSFVSDGFLRRSIPHDEIIHVPLTCAASERRRVLCSVHMKPSVCIPADASRTLLKPSVHFVGVGRSPDGSSGLYFREQSSRPLLRCLPVITSGG